MFKIASFYFLCFIFFNQPLPVASRYPREYKFAFDFCKSITLKTDSISKKFNITSQSILPIVFPECMRYSVVKDHLETSALNVLYVNFGNKYSDFSIGRFQMKPSFVEMLEKEVLSNPELLKEFQFLTKYSTLVESKIRMHRVGRLSQLDWQINYLCCFYRIIEMRFKNIKFKSEDSKIDFYATAYNLGFWKSFQEIEKQQQMPTFPGGYVDYEKNYPYGTIAVDFYKLSNYSQHK